MMNNQKNGFQHQVLQGLGSLDDRLPQSFINQQDWNVGNCIQQQHALEDGSIQQSLGPAKSSSSGTSPTELPTRAFYSTDRYAGIPFCESQTGNLTWCYPNSKTCSTQFHSCQSNGENLCIGAPEQNDLNFAPSTLQSVEKSQLNGNQYNRLSQIPSNVPPYGLLENKIVPLQQNKFPGYSVSFGERNFQPSFDGNINTKAHCDAYNSALPQLSIFSQPEKTSPKLSSRNVPIASGSSVSAEMMLSNKTRIRWTQDLHEKFVECVKLLGGAEKATPKAILKLMDTGGLTIFHVKSHLQKYRIAKYIPDSAEGKGERRSNMKDVPQLEMNTGLQLRDALHLQLDVQRRLHEQLEIQRNLQMRIEEQGRQLKMMFDEQKKANKRLFSSKNLDGTSVSEPLGPEIVQNSMAEDSGNTDLPSNIS